MVQYLSRSTSLNTYKKQSKCSLLGTCVYISLPHLTKWFEPQMLSFDESELSAQRNFECKFWILGKSLTLQSSRIYILHLFGAALIFCKEQQKHSGQQCSRSINLVSRDFVDSTAIATSPAVKKRSLCYQSNPTLTFPLSGATFWPKYVWHKSRCAFTVVNFKVVANIYVTHLGSKYPPWRKFLNAIRRLLLEEFGCSQKISCGNFVRSTCNIIIDHILYCHCCFCHYLHRHLYQNVLAQTKIYSWFRSWITKSSYLHLLWKGLKSSLTFYVGPPGSLPLKL